MITRLSLTALIPLTADSSPDNGFVGGGQTKTVWPSRFMDATSEHRTG